MSASAEDVIVGAAWAALHDDPTVFDAAMFLAALRAAGYVVERDWQDISTAPRDGAYQVTNRLGEVCLCQARDGSRIILNMPGYADWSWPEPATHWRPLPAPPT